MQTKGSGSEMEESSSIDREQAMVKRCACLIKNLAVSNRR